MPAEFEIVVHWSDREPPIVSRLGADAARDLVALLAAGIPDELPAGRAVPDADDPWSLLLGLQAFYRVVLSGDGAVAIAARDGGLWTVPARVVKGVSVRMVPPTPGQRARSRPAGVPDAFRQAFTGPGEVLDP
jgi:hypothetical protein